LHDLNRLRDRAGVALPMAVIGLVLVSVLTIGAIVVAGSEFSATNAHQDATRQLYNAERGLQRYLTTVATGGALPEIGTSTVTPPGERYPVRVTVAEMGRSTSGSTITITYSATAAVLLPGNALGRTLMAMFTAQVPAAGGLALPAGATFAGDVTIDGSIRLAGIQEAAKCAMDTVRNSLAMLTGAKLVLKTDSAKALPQGKVTLNMNVEQLKYQLLRGQSVQDLANKAQIRFPYGTRQAGSSISVGGYTASKPESKAPLATTTTTGQKVSPVRVTTYNPSTSHPYNWGCPYTTMGRTGCDWTPAADTTFYPIISIDARGGTVTLAGDHGQGLLVVTGGNITIGSTFFFKGIIVADGELDINSTARVDGAVVGFGAVDVVGDDDIHNIMGSTIITYDQCVVDKMNALLGAGVGAGSAPVISQAFAWREVVR